MIENLKEIYVYKRPLFKLFQKQLSVSYFFIIPTTIFTAFLGEPYFDLKFATFFLLFPLFCSIAVLPIVWFVDNKDIKIEHKQADNTFITNRFNKIN